MGFIKSQTDSGSSLQLTFCFGNIGWLGTICFALILVLRNPNYITFIFSAQLSCIMGCSLNLKWPFHLGRSWNKFVGFTYPTLFILCESWSPLAGGAYHPHSLLFFFFFLSFLTPTSLWTWTPQDCKWLFSFPTGMNIFCFPMTFQF